MTASKADDLRNKKCVPCEGGVAPLSKEKSVECLSGLKGWQLSSDTKSIHCDYLMKNFMSAVELIQAIASVAEKEDHHPDIHLTGYRKLRIELSTHAIGGLSENDFILAAKIDHLPKKLKS